jgi:D-hydroxyproline dehydrogenase subunit beta
VTERPAAVVVIGAGIVGASVAGELAVRGVDVLLLDAGAVSSGTTGLGEGNVLCSDKDAGPELELAVLGLAAYDEIEASYGERARIRRKGALVVHRSEAGIAAERARIERLRAAGVECELLGPAQARALEPGLGEMLGATWVPGDLQCDPRAITRAMAAEPGITLRTHTRVDDLGALRADHVVLAAGPWSAALARTVGLHLPLEPRKGQLVRLGPLPVGRKVVDGSYLGSVMSAEAGLQVTTVVETTWDGEVLVGSSRERRGFDTSVDDAVSDEMVARAARLFPRLTSLPRVAAWAGLRPWLPDHLPAIGPCSAAEGVWLATGHEGAGVALGPVTGRLVAQLYCGEPPCADPAPFDPDRFLR